MSELAEDGTMADEEDSVVKENLTTEMDEINEDEPQEVEPSEDEPEVVVTIGDAPPAEEEEDQTHDPVLVNKLRKEVRHRDREIKRLSQELEQKAKPQEAKIEIGVEPTLDSCNYDEQQYKNDLLSWHERKRQADEQANKIKEQEQTAQQSYQERLNAYHEAKAKLNGVDFEEAEAFMNDLFSQTQIGLIINVAKNPEQVIAALSKNQAKAKELAAILSPDRYAAAIGALETQLKVTPKKSAPAPEGKVNKGSARLSGTVDSRLESLRAEALKSGDVSKVVQYQLSKRSK